MARRRKGNHVQWDPTKHLRAGKGATGGQGGRFVKQLVSTRPGSTAEHPDTGVKVKAGTISHQGRTRKVYSVEGGETHRSAEAAAAAAGRSTAGAGGGVGEFSGPGTHTGWLGRYRKWSLADLEQENILLASEPERFDANSIQVRRSAMRTALREAKEKDSSVGGVKGKFKKGDTVYHVDDAAGSKEADAGSWGGNVEDMRADPIGNGKLEYKVFWAESKSSVWVPEGFLMGEKEFKEGHKKDLPAVGSRMDQHDRNGNVIRMIKVVGHNRNGTVQVEALNGPLAGSRYEVKADVLKKPEPKPKPDPKPKPGKTKVEKAAEGDKLLRSGSAMTDIKSAYRVTGPNGEDGGVIRQEKEYERLMSGSIQYGKRTFGTFWYWYPNEREAEKGGNSRERQQRYTKADALVEANKQIEAEASGLKSAPVTSIKKGDVVNSDGADKTVSDITEPDGTGRRLRLTFSDGTSKVFMKTDSVPRKDAKPEPEPVKPTPNPDPVNKDAKQLKLEGPIDAARIKFEAMGTPDGKIKYKDDKTKQVVGYATPMAGRGFVLTDAHGYHVGDFAPEDLGDTSAALAKSLSADAPGHKTKQTVEIKLTPAVWGHVAGGSVAVHGDVSGYGDELEKAIRAHMSPTGGGIATKSPTLTLSKDAAESLNFYLMDLADAAKHGGDQGLANAHNATIKKISAQLREIREGKPLPVVKDGMSVKMKGKKFVYELRVNGEVVASRTSEVPYAWARKKVDPDGGVRYSFHKTKPSGGVEKYQLQQPDTIDFTEAEDPNSAIGKEAAKAREVMAKVRGRKLPNSNQIRESKVDLYEIAETNGRANGEHKGSVQTIAHTTDELVMIGEYVQRVLSEIDYDREKPEVVKARSKRIEANNAFNDADQAWRKARADNRASTFEAQLAHRDEVKRLAAVRDQAKLDWAKAGRDYEKLVAPGLAEAREALTKEQAKASKLDLARMEWRDANPGRSEFYWPGKAKLDRQMGAVDRAQRAVAVQQRYHEEVNAARVVRALQAVRPGFGTGEFKTSGTQISDLFDLAGKHLPKEWVDAMMGSYGRGPIRVVQRQGARAHYDKWAGNGGEILMASGSRSYSTALHEVGHYVEDVLPAVKKMEAEFYEHRTKGEIAKQLNKINPGHGYRKDEKAREDKFASAYMGKDYGGQFYELLTMGLQGVFYNDHNLRSRDPEYFKWMLGLLAAA